MVCIFVLTILSLDPIVDQHDQLTTIKNGQIIAYTTARNKHIICTERRGVKYADHD